MIDTEWALVGYGRLRRERDALRQDALRLSAENTALREALRALVDGEMIGGEYPRGNGTVSNDDHGGYPDYICIYCNTYRDRREIDGSFTDHAPTCPITIARELLNKA